jgi:NAD(P)H-flavin reductase
MATGTIGEAPGADTATRDTASCCQGTKNSFRPYLMRISAISDEAPAIRTFRLEFADPAEGEAFRFRTGQFGLYGVFGEGESTFCIASSPTRSGFIECTFREVGRVTAALARREVGDLIGFRGPYGNEFPIEGWRGKNLLFVAGGIALPPLRSVIWNVLDCRERFGDVTIVYGARSVKDLVYKRELEEWAARGDVRVVVTVDPGGETPEWKGEKGFVPQVLERVAPASADAVALVCGPPIMIKLTLPVLEQLGFGKGAIYTTLENRMKCGIGKCGRCNTGRSYVCKDGPVYTLAQLEALPVEY